MKGSAFGRDKKRFTRLLSLALVILMFCSLVPVGALAADDIEEPAGEVSAGGNLPVGVGTDESLVDPDWEPEPEPEEPVAPAEEEPAAPAEEPADDPAEDPADDPAEDPEDELPPDNGETPSGDNLLPIEEAEGKGEDEDEDAEAAPAQSAETTVSLVADNYRPPMHFEAKSNGLTVIVDAPGETLPFGTAMRVAPVRDQETLQAIGDEVGADASRVTAVDISFLYEGGEIEPDGYIFVTLKADVIAATEDAQVVHMDDYGNTQVVEQYENNAVDEVSFVADSFSVYAVVDSGTYDESRMTLNFYNGSTLIATVYVKKNDDTDEALEQIIYDPGVGEVPANTIFKGWSLDDANYTTESAASAMDVEDIRAWAKTKTGNDSITEGEVHNFYAMIFQTYSVTFQDENGVTLHGEALIFKPGETVTYVVNQPYTPADQNSQFQGWYATSTRDPVTKEDGSAIGTVEAGPITNPTTVVIHSDTVFTPRAPKGYWLVFNTNTASGTSRSSYVPPQFVMEGTNTQRPDDPIRVGYRFDGWYDNAACTGSAFTFGNTLGARTELYAKWTPVTTANYTVIIWQRNVDDTGYDFVESVTLSGPTNSTINTVTQQGTGDSAYARVNGVNKTYTGFHLKEFDQNVTITPEGNAILNVYYDRTEYTLRFFYARSYTYNNRTYIQVCVNNEGFLQGRNNNRNLNTSLTHRGSNDYQLLSGSNTWKDVNNNSVNGNALNLVSGAYLAKEEVTSGSIAISNVRTDAINANGNVGSTNTRNMTYYYLDVKVRYGQSLEDLWPVPNSTFIAQTMTSYNRSNTGYTTVSPLLEGSWATGKNIGGLYGQMTTNLFVGNDTTAYFITYWRYETYYTYQYNVYFSTLEGETATTNYKGKGYVLQSDLSYTVANGQGWGNTSLTDSGQGYWDVDNVTFDGTDLVGRQDNQDSKTINVYYDRKVHNIIYHDGIYVNGDGGTIQNKKGEMWKETAVLYGADLSPYAEGQSKYYEPEAPEGFVFEGWYMDSEGQNPYTFSGTMPDKDIEVYAKWRQIQYRVFLHPQVPDDATNLDWGGQGMSFRVNEGEKIAGGNKIIGTADGYEFIGWYTDPACTDSFEMSAVTLNDSTVTEDYDQTEPTELDDRGNPETDENKDATNDRYWITKKLDLYGKWRATIEGAKGIHVVYEANSEEVYGHFANNETTYTDPMAYYLDRAEANAAGASVPNDTEKYQFMYWVVQRWNGTEYEDTDTHVYPGDTFEVLKSYARVEDIANPDPNDPDASKSYTVHIRAEYGEVGAPTPTHIDWYPNYDDNYAVHSDTNLQINEAVAIRPKLTREGYTFLGWARVPTTQSNSHEATDGGTTKLQANVLNLTYDDVYLYYHADSNTFTAKVDSEEGTELTVTQVAADEVTPYHDMYAVWEKNIDITVHKDWNQNQISADHKPDSFTVELLANGESLDPAKTVTFTKDDNYADKLFQNLPPRDANGNKITYSVVETGATGWKARYENNSIQAPGNNQDPQPVKITNSPEYGSIKIEKHVAGPTEALDILADYLKELTFILEGPFAADGTTHKATYARRELSYADFNNSGTSFSGQYELDWIEPGIYYLWETNAETLLAALGYQVMPADGVNEARKITITLNDGGDKQQRLTNEYQRGELGNLTVQKQVEGHDTGKFPYSFRVKYQSAADSTAYYLTGDNAPYTMVVSSEDAKEYSLANATSAVNLARVPAGTYTIEELNTEEGGSAWIDYYTLAVSYDPEGGSLAIAAGETKNVTITNTYTRQTASVDLNKIVTGNLGDVNKKFPFTVQVKDGNTVLLTREDIELSHNGTTTLENIPVGATVIISEPETVKTQDGYTVSAAGVKGTGGTGTDTLSDTNFNSTVFTFTMPEEGATVTFTNEKKVTVDTGVSLDIIPFILIITLTVLSSGAMLLEHRRRRRNER